MAQTDIDTAVYSAVVQALGVDDDEVTPDATLMDDLGAESIDLLDILFRVEKSTGIKIQASDLGEYIQGGIPDDEFGTEGGTVTDVGLAQLKNVMPQIDVAELEGKLPPDQVINLFTVQNLADMVSSRAASAGA